MNPTLHTENPRTGLSLGNPNSVANVKRWNAAQMASGHRRKRRFIKVIKRYVDDTIASGKPTFPDYLALAKSIDIPYSTFNLWMADPMVQAELDVIEEVFVQNAEKVVFRGLENQPYLALDVLRARRPGKWSNRPELAQYFQNVTVLTSVRDGAAPVPDPNEVQASSSEESEQAKPDQV